jgi:hypothetical protein
MGKAQNIRQGRKDGADENVEFPTEPERKIDLSTDSSGKKDVAGTISPKSLCIDLRMFSTLISCSEICEPLSFLRCVKLLI